MARDRYPPVLVLHAQVCDLNLIEFDLRSLLGLHGLKLHELASVGFVQLHGLIHSGKGGLSRLRDLCLPVVLGLFLVLSCYRLGRVVLSKRGIMEIGTYHVFISLYLLCLRY